jgi:ATP-dependent exoDNAse (exonuclease V) beta subunit
VDKRDFGNWLHAVLQRFHEDLRDQPTDDAHERSARMDAAAEAVTREQRLQDGDFLPFAAGWAQLRDGYLHWLAGHEQQGAMFRQAEVKAKQPLGDLELIGTIDRIDGVSSTGEPTVLVIDYKTESDSVTRQRIKSGAEDTQLPFYAALLHHDTLRAAYVNVGERGETQLHEQDEVVHLRDVLIEGIQHDMARIAAGAPRCPRWARARCASSAPCAACAAKTIGQMPSRHCPRQRRHDRQYIPPHPGRLRTQRPPRLARGLLRHCLRPAPQRGGGGLRGRGQDLDAGLAHAARAARWLRAARDILAITFTKKAAGEMRQRLQEWLEQFSHKPLDELTAELIARGISPQGALEKREALQNLYRQLLEAGRPVQIRTFHSWFAALLGTAPLALLQQQGLPAHFELLEDDAEAVREVWPPFLQAVAESASLRADYEAVVARHGRSQTHKALAAALAKRVEFDLADDAGVVDASVPPFQQAYPELAAWAEPAEALQDAACQQRWRNRASALGAESNKTPQKAADAIIDALACPDLNQRLDMLRKAMFVAKEDRLSKNLEKFPAAQEAEPELQRLLVARRQHEAWQHQQRMARLARCLIAQFAAVKQQHGWVDMNDVERTALVMLADPILWLGARAARCAHSPPAGR